MNKKIILTADSTCDLGNELIERYNVKIIPLHVILNNNSYDDLVNINPNMIYENFDKTGTLPKTAAVNTQEYIDFFKPYVNDGYEVIHFNIGSALSVCYQNTLIAAKELGHIYPIDSCSLSTGSGLLVIEAALQIANSNLSAKEIAEKVQALTSKSHASFIVDKLDYLRAGGRCSAVAVFGANILGIKPCIEVNNKDGSMAVGKKYRGKLEKVLTTYVEEKLDQYSNIRKDRIFITHAGIDEKYIKHVYDILKSKNYFDEILITQAGCTISSHCGPNTLGILFMTE